jgi:hypothetical protein
LIRNLYIIQYLDQSTAWYLSQTLQIQTKNPKYQRGDILEFSGQKYVVIEDFGRLRVKRFTDEINPFVPLSQILNQ